MSKQMTPLMAPPQFEKLIAAYGSKPAHWPDDHRAAMLELAESHHEAAAIIARAAALDATLDARLPDSADLEVRILRDMDTALSAEIVSLAQKPDTSSRGLWTMGMALAACFVGGFMAAPVLIDIILGSADLTASLDIISDAFLPTEPL